MDIIFDVDGTLMNVDHRRHFVDKSVNSKADWKLFNDSMVDDTPNDVIFNIAKSLRAGDNRIIIVSGRQIKYRALTMKQIMSQGLLFEGLFMRDDKDFRPDYEVKLDMLNYMRLQGFNPVLAFDDRDTVVKMFRDQGLTVCQVAEGDF